jgi:hypothetical protein
MVVKIADSALTVVRGAGFNLDGGKESWIQSDGGMESRIQP